MILLASIFQKLLATSMFIGVRTTRAVAILRVLKGRARARALVRAIFLFIQPAIFEFIQKVGHCHHVCHRPLYGEKGGDFKISVRNHFLTKNRVSTEHKLASYA